MPRAGELVLALLAVCAAGCGGRPAVSAAPELLVRGRPGEAVALYARHAERAGDDLATLRAMARGTLALGLRAGAAGVQVAAIQAVERQEIEALALDVARLIGADDERVSAAAAVALLRAHPDAPLVCTERLASDDPAVRAICVEGIGRKVGALARGELAPMLADGDAGVRRAAVAAVGRMRAARDTAALVALAGRDPAATVRVAALRALRGRTDPLILPLALRTLGLSTGGAAAGKSDPHLGARLAAIDLVADAGQIALLAAAGRGGDPRVALAVAAHRAGPGPENSRAACCGANCRGARPRYNSDPPRRLLDVFQRACVDSEGGAGDFPRHFAPRDGVSRIIRASGREALARALADPRWPTRAAALNLAEQLASGDQLAAIAGRAIADRQPEVRLAAARVLLRLGLRARATIELRAALRAADPDLRLDAAGELARTGDHDALRQLAALARNRDPAVRAAAIAAHGRARWPTAGLVAALADADPLLRIAAAEVLLELPG